MAPTSKEIGTALELRVARALHRGGYRGVQRNLVLTDRHGNRSEIDVAYQDALWRRRYIECKAYHGSGSSVGLEEVAKFKEVLSLNGIPLSRGLFITTTGYVPRALTTGVATLDGAGLEAWEARLAWRGLLRRSAGALAVGGALLAAGAAAAVALQGAEASGSGSGVLAQARQGWAEGAGGARRGGSGGGSAWDSLRASLSGSLGSGRQHEAAPAEALARDAGYAAGAALARARAWWARAQGQ
jgi:hypothetical protein